MNSQNTRSCMWLVYLLECADKSLYCGITTDMARRLDEHNGVRYGGAKYTCTRRPVRLLVVAPCQNRSAAARLEHLVQHLPRHKKLAYLVAMGNEI